MRKEKKPFRIFVVEDHEVMRDVLRETVERLPECEFAGAAPSAEDALAALKHAVVDVVLVDLSLPRMGGVEFVRTLSQRSPDLRCLIVSGHLEPVYARQALEAGAYGYVIKERFSDIAAGIQAAMSGRQFLSAPFDELCGEGQKGKTGDG